MKKTEKIIAVVTMLADTFRQPLGDGAFEGYRIGLDDLTEEELSVCAARAVRESKFMPSPAELRSFAGAGETRAAEATAALAWSVVTYAMRVHDAYRSVDFGPLVNAVITNLGGWIRLCDMTTRDLTFARKDFERVFLLFADKDHRILHAAPLRGLHAGPTITIQIPGLSGSGTRPALEPIDSSAGVMRAIVGELADRKS